MMLCGISHVFALTFAICTTLGQLLPRKSGDGINGEKIASKRGFKAAFMCSEAGNCTCLFEKLAVVVECTSARDKLDAITSDLPQTTTHL